MKLTQNLDVLIDEYMKEQFEEFPVEASYLGIDGYDDKLGDFSAEAFERRDARDDEWLSAFGAVADEGLAAEQRIDRDLIVSALRGGQVVRDWKVWKRNPDAYLGSCLYGLFSLFLHRLRPENELAEAAAARMKAIPGVLEHAKANLDPRLASKIFVERSAGACKAGITYSRNLVPAEVAEGPSRELLVEAGEGAARAFEDFATFLDKLASASEGPYAIGDDRYSALLTQKEMLGYGAREMRERGRAAYEDLAQEITRLARDLRGTDDWREVVEELNKEHPPTPEEMRRAYAEWTEAARAFCYEKGLVSAPEGETCDVVPSPPFQRPVLAVASYMPPPAFKPTLKGHFFVPFPPDGTPEEEVQKRLEDNNFGNIPTTSVHEAYPGHHWHFVWFKSNPRVIRRIVGSSYFAEGWALYAERMMREQGFFTDPRHELYHVEARLFRAARIVVDTSLHIGDMTFDEAVDFMHHKAGRTEPVAKAEVGRYCTWPTQASSYLTGALEIERIRGAYLTGGSGGGASGASGPPEVTNGDGRDLRSFHDALAGSGMLPIALAERAVLGG